MLHDRVYFEHENQNVYIDTYVADKVGKYTKSAILVIPGGGYSCICSEREGEPIALAFMPYGYNAFVLHYSVNREKKYPAQLIQVSKAIKHIKDNAEKYNVDPDKVFVVGFSAGGHLAGSIATMWHKQEIYDEVDMEYGYNKPTGAMLIYPVVVGGKDYSHEASFKNLLVNDNPSEEEFHMVSIDANVSKKSCPAYIVHTATDQVVNVKNSLDLARAYSEAGVAYEMHIYPEAMHGIALANEITECGIDEFNNPCIAKWVENAVDWAKFITK